MKYLFLSALAFLITLNLQSQFVTKITKSTEIIALQSGFWVYSASENFLPGVDNDEEIAINIETLEESRDSIFSQYLIFSFLKFDDMVQRKLKYTYVMDGDDVPELKSLLDYVWSQRKEDNIRIEDEPFFGFYVYENKLLTIKMYNGGFTADPIGNLIDSLQFTIDLKQIKKLRKHLSSGFLYE
tara:strand:+ start:220 stop:771 length:552 start_codon:yes stop_codon:yes gene_type:complete